MTNKKILLNTISLLMASSPLLANSKQLNFTTKIDSVCGIEITKNTGSIDFDDKTSNNQATFKVKTNSKQGYSKVKFSNISKSENIQNENGLFIINDSTNIDWSNPQTTNIKHNEEQKIIAKINKNSNEIIAGDARVTTTLEIECVDK